jgi:hypothetical protein
MAPKSRAGTSHPPNAGPPVAGHGNGPKTSERRSASKLAGFSGRMVAKGFIGERVEFPRFYVSLDLAVPCSCIKLSATTAEKKRMPETSTDLSGDAVVEISRELRKMLADVFAHYLKTKNFHWHMSGPHFRDYHLLLDEQGSQIFAMTDDIAERAHKNRGNYNQIHQRCLEASAAQGQQRRRCRT